VHALYTEYSLLKYDSRDAALRFGDVVELVNPRYHKGEYGTWRDALWRHAIERRHGRGNEVPEVLAMIRANDVLRARAAADPAVLLDADALKAAGMTWEDALSLAGPNLAKRDLWTALIPSMGYAALLRNVRNFDEAGVDDEVARAVAARLADPDQVAKSRQFPFRFLSACRAAPSLRWSYSLELALGHSMARVPRLPGRTLILVDRSGSMFDRMSPRSGVSRADTAALFGSVLALRSEHADLVEFGTSSGTHTADAVRRHFRDGFHDGAHARVVLVTDEQVSAGAGDPLSLIPAQVPVYTWNLAGYRLGHGPSGIRQRHAFGGLADSAFAIIALLESGRDAGWPWEDRAA
jgi:hypothetical protein